MNLEDLKIKYDKLQIKYGAKELDSIYNGGQGSEWTPEFAEKVYENVIKHNYFITNLGKCTQIDARPLSDEVLKKYLNLLKCEIDIIKPKVIILFGNQVSSIVLNKKISVSENRRVCHTKKIKGKSYKFYAVYYPVGNSRFNMDKSILDIKWIMDKELNENINC